MKKKQDTYLSEEALELFTRNLRSEPLNRDADSLEKMKDQSFHLTSQYEEIADLWDELYLLSPDSEISAPNRSLKMRRWYGLGAGVAATILIATILFSQFLSITEKPEYYETMRGQRLVVTLDDDSIVHLNSMTRLSVRYDDNERLITMLKGEALFNVVPDTRRRFVVNTKRGNVEAIGTEFNIRYSDQDLKVSVLKGTIKLSSEIGKLPGDKGAKVATDGEQLVINSGGDITESRLVNINNISAWTRGQLIFDGEPLEEVVKTVNLHGKHEIRIRDPELRSLQVYGVFNAGDTSGFLSAVQKTFPIRSVEISDNVTWLIESKK